MTKVFNLKQATFLQMSTAIKELKSSTRTLIKTENNYVQLSIWLNNSKKVMEPAAQGPSIKVVGIFQGGRGGLKFRYCKILEGRSSVNQGQNSDMGEGGIKNCQKIRRLLWMAPYIKGRSLSRPCTRLLWQRNAGPNSKIPPKIRFKKFVKLTGHTHMSATV